MGIEIRKVTVGPWPMNAYVLIDPDSRSSIIVDPGADVDKILANTSGTTVQQILLTHADWDHIAALPEMISRTGAPVAAHAEAAGQLEAAPERNFQEDDIVTLGDQQILVIETPGHAPGHVSFFFGNQLIGGDVLFPGGPGRTASPTHFQQIVRTITEVLFALPDDVTIYPGHGENVTMARAKSEYAAFVARETPADLFGDVTWV